VPVAEPPDVEEVGGDNAWEVPPQEIAEKEREYRENRKRRKPPPNDAEGSSST
jgi:hypothetical protein